MWPSMSTSPAASQGQLSPLGSCTSRVMHGLTYQHKEDLGSQATHDLNPFLPLSAPCRIASGKEPGQSFAALKYKDG